MRFLLLHGTLVLPQMLFLKSELQNSIRTGITWFAKAIALAGCREESSLSFDLGWLRLSLFYGRGLVDELNRSVFGSDQEVFLEIWVLE